MGLGKHQLNLLGTLANPKTMLIGGDDPVARSLRERGLVSLDGPDASCAGIRVTPAGLRALAEAIESGEAASLFDPAYEPERWRFFFRGRGAVDCGPIGEGG